MTGGKSRHPDNIATEVERDPVYVVRTPAFDGPIELLLTLAQRSEVDLKAISLASLTDDYLRAIEQDHPPLDRLAAFLVIGARLVQLKAAGLMPDADSPCGSAHGRADARDSSDSPRDCPRRTRCRHPFLPRVARRPGPRFTASSHPGSFGHKFAGQDRDVGSFLGQ